MKKNVSFSDKLEIFTIANRYEIKEKEYFGSWIDSFQKNQIYIFIFLLIYFLYSQTIIYENVYFYYYDIGIISIMLMLCIIMYCMDIYYT